MTSELIWPRIYVISSGGAELMSECCCCYCPELFSADLGSSWPLAGTEDAEDSRVDPW